MARYYRILFIYFLIYNILAYILLAYHYFSIKTCKNTNSLIKFKEYDYNDDKLIEMSQLLNEAMNKVGKLSCESNEYQYSDNGGWCSKISGKNSPQHMTDFYLARALSEFLKGKSVVSFGDGPGVYRELLLEYGEVSSYDSYDGAPYVKETTNNNVKFLDLSVPIYHLKMYDWVISLEVAEQIYSKFENVYIDNILRYARQGIILSWADIGQPGHSHVNNRNLRKKLAEKGFIHDVKASNYMKKKASFPWYKSNLNIYIKNEFLNKIIIN